MAVYGCFAPLQFATYICSLPIPVRYQRFRYLYIFATRHTNSHPDSGKRYWDNTKAKWGRHGTFLYIICKLWIKWIICPENTLRIIAEVWGNEITFKAYLLLSLCLITMFTRLLSSLRTTMFALYIYLLICNWLDTYNIWLEGSAVVLFLYHLDTVTIFIYLI